MLALRRKICSVLLISASLLAASCAGIPQGHTTALHEAAGRGDIDSLVISLSRSENIDLPDEEGLTALHHAVKADDIPVAAALLNAGADPDYPDKDGRTALHYAVLSCNPDMIAMILAADADVNLSDGNDAVPLDLAVSADCGDAASIIRSSLPGFVPQE